VHEGRISGIASAFGFFLLFFSGCLHFWEVKHHGIRFSEGGIWMYCRYGFGNSRAFRPRIYEWVIWGLPLNLVSELADLCYAKRIEGVGEVS
jgi:hypothetical protein